MELDTPALALAAPRPADDGVEIGINTLLPHKPRLLVVDDQPTNVQALYQAFSMDHQVLMATTGEQALKVCHDKQPDLVLLDVEMPGMDGYEVCKRLKADAATRDIPVIFVTGHTDEEAESRGLDVGAVDFISKPINPRIVRARARTHITLKAQSDRLRALAFVDGLTGLFNRRCFDERLDSEVRRAARTGKPLALLMFDVDHFKKYNDHYGHQGGDDCLKLLAAATREIVRRPGDLAARYGGEEFVCILPETEFSGAVGLAEMLLGRVAELGIAHARSDIGSVMTISIGVAGCAAGQITNPTDLLALADRQLYLAKTGGRARVCAAALDSPSADPSSQA